MHAIDHLVDALLGLWREEGATLLPGATQKDLQLFEANYGVCIPCDMRFYLERIGGMAEGVWDGDMISFHTVSRIAPLYDEMKGYTQQRKQVLSLMPDANNVFIFADYLTSSHYYAIKLFPPSHGGANEVLWVCTESFITLSTSFSEFLSRYISHRETILFP